MQLRPKRDADSGVVSLQPKPRATFNLSFGAPSLTPDESLPARQRLPPSPNAGMAAADTAVRLPTYMSFAHAAAVQQEMATDDAGVGAGGSSIDATSAYSYLLVQALDRWMQCFFWHGGVRVALRVVFGGAHGPERFCSVASFPRQIAERRITDLQRRHPPPPGVIARCAACAALQERGLLRAGVEQTRPWYIQAYLDDINLSALDYHVPMPPQFAAIDLGREETRRAGGRPASPDSFLAVATAIIIATLVEFGFDVADKTMCGSVVVSLGARVLLDRRLVDVPALKCAGILLAIDAMQVALFNHRPIDVDDCERLTGRLVNLSELYPEFLTWMHAGYALVKARLRHANGRRFRPRTLRLQPNGRRELELREMLAVARSVLERNGGAPLSSSRRPIGVGSTGAVTFASDASGNDGVGGFAFVEGIPKTVFIVHDPWPGEILRALEHAARGAAASTAALGYRPDMLVVPAAEAFGQLGVPLTVARHLGIDPPAVTAIGDCMPVARALAAGASGSPQVGVILRECLRLCRFWVPAHVKREFNTSCDALSHPAMAAGVVKQARRAGLSVVELAFHDDCWLTVFDACRHSLGVEDKTGQVPAPYVRVGRMEPPVPAGWSRVDMRRPSPLGNPFRLWASASSEQRDASCDAHATAFRIAMAGEESSLLAIAALFGIDRDQVDRRYADLPWATYASRVREAFARLRRRVQGRAGVRGEQILLGCTCHPLRCHCDTIAARLAGSCSGDHDSPADAGRPSAPLL